VSVQPAPRLSPGDLVEVETPQGLAYLHISHEAPPYPYVVRVVARNCPVRPDDLEALLARAPEFVCLAPLPEILARGAIIGRKIASVPSAAQPFPVFRTPIRDRLGEVVYWWLWDGTGLRWCGTDTADIETYPMREIIGAQELLARLAAPANSR
jgi:hypothetical protein